MATIGLSKPYWAKYNYDPTTKAVTYSGGLVLGKATRLDVQLDDADANILYGDNAPAESETAFTGGAIALSTTELLPETGSQVLGTRKEAITGVNGLTTENASWYVDDDDANAPYGGVGGILKKKVDGQYKYVAVIFEKVQFTTPGDTATTQGETVEWQVPTLNGTLMRSEAAKHPWRRKSSLLDSEADAELLIRSYLNIPDNVPGPPSEDEPAAAADGTRKAAAK